YDGNVQTDTVIVWEPVTHGARVTLIDALLKRQYTCVLGTENSEMTSQRLTTLLRRVFTDVWDFTRAERELAPKLPTNRTLLACT
ncbi:hypothetical protein ACXWQL_09440, partial [Streptococcus pyogenes]